MTTTPNGYPNPDQRQTLPSSETSQGVPPSPRDPDLLPIPPNYYNPMVPQVSDTPNPGDPLPIGVCRDRVSPVYAMDPALMCGPSCLLRHIPPPHSQKCPGNGECFNILFEHTLRVASVSLKAKKKAEEIAKIQAKIEAREEARHLAKASAKGRVSPLVTADGRNRGTPGGSHNTSECSLYSSSASHHDQELIKEDSHGL